MYVCMYVCMCFIYTLIDFIYKYTHILTVDSESIQTPFTLFYFVMLQPDITIVLIHLFLINIHSVLHNDKVKTEF